MKHLLKYFLAVVILVVTVYGEIKVSYVGGEVYFKRNNRSQRITFGMELKPGDVLTTSKRSFVALLFDDGSVHKITANTVYKIENYKNNKNSRLQLFKIIKGKIFSFISKTFKKSDIKFISPTAVVGVRGTSFVMEVNQGGTTVYMLEGQVVLSDVNSKSSSPVSAGEKGEFSRKGTFKKENMTQADYEAASKDIPVSLGEVRIDSQTKEEEAKLAEEQEKELLRSYVDESTKRVDQQREEINQNKSWDYRSEKTVGRFHVSQVVKKPADNEIKLITHTYNSQDKKQSTLDLGIVFDEAIPNIADVLSGTVRNIDNIVWKMTVSKENNADELLYTRSYKDKVEEISFNKKKGSGLVTKELHVQDTNVRIPTFIKFKINGGEYKFDLDYRYNNSDTTEGIEITSPDNKSDNTKTYNRILNGDLDTHINVTATLPEGVNANLLKTGDTFKIIIINNFLFPLFNNISS